MSYLMRPRRQDYTTRIVKYADFLGCSFEDFGKEIVRMYVDEKMSADEIAEYLSKIDKISPRSVLRWIDKNIDPKLKRGISDAFPLAASRGRVKWHKRDPLLLARRKRIGGYKGAEIRYSVMKRDGFKCVLCGSTASDAPLEIDHIIPIAKGGSNNLNNLRTVCEICNIGKQVNEHEYYKKG